MNNAQSEATSEEPAEKAGSFNIVGTIQALRRAKEPLLTQLKLHQKLLGIEWQEEKKRLACMLALSLCGFAFFICLLMATGILVVALCWHTNYLILSIAILCGVYALGFFITLMLAMKYANKTDSFFSASREELMADLELIMEKLS